jgi:hypothetical protein
VKQNKEQHSPPSICGRPLFVLGGAGAPTSYPALALAGGEFEAESPAVAFGS